MEALIASVTTVFTAAIGWVSTVADTIVDTPVLLLYCVAIPLVYLGVNMFKKLLSARG